MFNPEIYEDLLFWREEVTRLLKNPEVKNIPADTLRRMNTLQLAFDDDVRQAMKFIEERARETGKGMQAEIHMPIPMMPLRCDGEEASINSYIRVIPLPWKGAPYYQAVLYTEADALVREWCDIKLGKFRP